MVKLRHAAGITECDIKPSVLLAAVVGFGKKRGPNSNPTS